MLHPSNWELGQLPAGSLPPTVLCSVLSTGTKQVGRYTTVVASPRVWFPVRAPPVQYIHTLHSHLGTGWHVFVLPRLPGSQHLSSSSHHKTTSLSFSSLVFFIFASLSGDSISSSNQILYFHIKHGGAFTGALENPQFRGR